MKNYAVGWLAQNPRLRSRTRELYDGLLRNHILPTLGHVELGRMTPAMVRRWHSELTARMAPGAPTVA